VVNHFIRSNHQKDTARKMSDEPTARIVGELPDGTVLMEDPEAEGVIAAVEEHNRRVNKENCKRTLSAQYDRVRHFVTRIKERGDDPREVVITLINVDDPHGGPLADILMPGVDWQQFRDRGETPYARGLAGREGIEEALKLFDPEAAEKLRDVEDIACVVIDHGVAEVFWH
jgi:hypothetical protein